jgi:hypothetical protein
VANGAITGGKVASGTLTGANVQDGSLTADDLPGIKGSFSLDPGLVTAGTCAPQSVTVPGIENGDQATISVAGAAPAQLFVQTVIQDADGTLKFRTCALGADVPAGSVDFSYGVIR